MPTPVDHVNYRSRYCQHLAAILSLSLSLPMLDCPYSLPVTVNVCKYVCNVMLHPCLSKSLYHCDTVSQISVDEKKMREISPFLLVYIPIFRFVIFCFVFFFNSLQTVPIRFFSPSIYPSAYRSTSLRLPLCLDVYSSIDPVARHVDLPVLHTLLYKTRARWANKTQREDWRGDTGERKREREREKEGEIHCYFTRKTMSPF